MGSLKNAAAAVAAMSTILLSAPAAANVESVEAAAKLRRLDIMLMVTGLRCRFGADNFQPDYERFTSNHIVDMTAAGRILEADLAASGGKAGARRALDRISTSVANQYGQGHPSLSCGELKSATQELAIITDTAGLLAAADELLAPIQATQLALASN